MSLEKIIERIEQDAKIEAEEIMKKASEASDKIIQDANQEANAVKIQILENARNQAEQHKQRIISSANLELRKSVLAEKQKAIDLAFSEALSILNNMKDSEYKKTIVGMVLQNVQTGDEEIVLSGKDKSKLGDGFIREINDQLARNGKKGNLSISKDTYNMIGGFVLRRGDIEINNSFDSLFQSSRDDLEAEVSRHLFPTE